MAALPTLLYLHGVGDGGQNDTWRSALESALTAIGYPDLAEIRVVAPKYPNGLGGVDDAVEVPKLSVPELRGSALERHRHEFARRRSAMESRLGADDGGPGLPGMGRIVAAVVEQGPWFNQARNYLSSQDVRGYVLDRVLRALGAPDQVVIVGHSLGSVIAADLLRRLPPNVQVTGMVTIGSPLAHDLFHVDRLTDVLKDPPSNLSWWVNFWARADGVPAQRGASSAIPWVLDQRIDASRIKAVRHPIVHHGAATYLSDEQVATAIAIGLFGSKSRALVHVPRGDDVPLDYGESVALLGLRFAHLVLERLDGDTSVRYAEALRRVQSETVDMVNARNAAEGRPMPTQLADLAIDLSDPASLTPIPATPTDLPMPEALVALVSIATANVIPPYEIAIDDDDRKAALKQLTIEMGLGSKVGAHTLDAAETARDVLDGPTNWWKWTAVGLGLAVVAVATGGLIFAAAPGAMGAAAITSALAAFGPGGMIGGLLTAGAMVTAGGGGIAAGLAAPATSAVTVEAVVTTQLAAAILRKKQHLAPDPQIWAGFTDLEVAVAQQLNRCAGISDRGAPSLKDLRRKREVISRALEYLREQGMAPSTPALPSEHERGNDGLPPVAHGTSGNDQEIGVATSE